MQLPLRSTALALVLPALALQAQTVPTPSQFLGITVGADRVLADYRQVARYFQELEKTSRRVRIEHLGPTTLGEDLIMAVISSEENLKHRARYQDIARKLSDPRGLAKGEIEALAQEGKAIIMVTCNIHSTEIGSSQMAMEWAHALATARDPETRRRLDNVILLLVPSLNPDGQIMETEWYRKHLGTPYEGGRMPWIYHPYTGHDNNRDWVMLTQKESRSVNHAAYFQWHPQVWFDEHQMGSVGPRIFVPPFANPVAPTVHPLVWRTVDAMGSHMSYRMELEGKAGAAYGEAFDAYWPGSSKNTAWWKNVAGMLSEVASVRLATPIEIHPSELRGGEKGLVEYKAQVNFPNPWKGGVWRLRDIMDYERTCSDALLENAADHRVDLLRGMAVMATDITREGRADAFWMIPAGQHDPVEGARLARLMAEHGVEVLAKGDGAFYLPTAQPYGRFVKEFFSVNRYPEVRPAPGADILAPYDVSAWSLPLHLGVEVREVTLDAAARKGLRPLRDGDGPKGGLGQGKAAAYALERNSNAATPLLNAYLKAGGKATVALEGFQANGKAFAAGTLLLEPSTSLAALAERHGLMLEALATRPELRTAPQKAPRVGIYKPWTASVDEGWTRFVLEQAGFEPRTLDNPAVKAGGLDKTLDVLVLADIPKDSLLDGRAKRGDGQYFEELPPEYRGGLGKEGLKAVKAFVEAGGTLVTLGASGELAMEAFNLPVRNALAGPKAEAFKCPGSLLRIQVDPGHPVTWGMRPEAAAFLQGKTAYATSLGGPSARHTVLASYPADARDILMSGWIRGEEQLERKGAAVAFEVGKGRVVLFGFQVQHRAQTEGTFKLLFNALEWAGLP
jgi:hypothetical protein